MVAGHSVAYHYPACAFLASLGTYTPVAVSETPRMSADHVVAFCLLPVFLRARRWLLFCRRKTRLSASAELSASTESLDPAAVCSIAMGGPLVARRHLYVHYHSRIHEVLGIARGSGKVQFEGPKGRTLTVKAGDVAILPAGTGHQCLKATEDFLVIGAYPPSGRYDECTSPADRKKALATIPKVARSRKDPVYGKNGPLMRVWRKSNRH